MKPRSWLVLIFAIGTIAVTIGIVMGMHDWIVDNFNIPSTFVDALEEFLKQYVAGLPDAPIS